MVAIKTSLKKRNYKGLQAQAEANPPDIPTPSGNDAARRPRDASILFLSHASEPIHDFHDFEIDFKAYDIRV